MESFRFNSNSTSIAAAMKEFGIIEQLKKAEADKKPGMCVAQCQADGIIRIGFIDHAKGLKIQEIMDVKIGTKGYV